MFGMILSMQQRSSEMMMQMSNNNQTQMTAILTALITKDSNGGSGNIYQKAMEQSMDMVKNMIDLKQTLNPEKQTVVDKVFGVMETVAPQIVEMMQQTQAQRAANPMYKMAVNSPEMQHLRENQDSADAVANKLDQHYGIQSTNDIMAVMGINRSQEMINRMNQAGQSTDATQVEPDVEEVQDADDNGMDVASSNQEQIDAQEDL